MEKEIWKDIPGYEGRYQASTLGRIRSLTRKVNGKNHYTGKPFLRTAKGQILRPGQFCKNGHVSVVLGNAACGSPVHQLIMKTFVGPCPDGTEVLHKNGNPKDNRLCNLRYGTRTENILDVYRQGKRWRKLNIEDVQQIRFGLTTGIKGSELAAMYQVSESCISSIKRGDTYSWLE
ncbi:NUMOD4 motif-containing HNH endonuclease [Lactimicrobium sp.]|jgi:hypothetical protein|uniref:NUMOD4 motif-containing HNH endonuclease n=1 Tax=Lactimicrobium sp. TaxID=2563780 RepID=UPI002F356061